MKTFIEKENEFNNLVEKLQKLCKCKYNNLSLENNNESVGRGSIFPSLIATCKMCNKKWYIFRGDINLAKTSEKIKTILNKMIKNNYGRCWLKEKFGRGRNEFENR